MKKRNLDHFYSEPFSPKWVKLCIKWFDTSRGDKQFVPFRGSTIVMAPVMDKNVEVTLNGLVKGHWRENAPE